MNDVLQPVVMVAPSHAIDELVQPSCDTPGPSLTRGLCVFTNSRRNDWHPNENPGEVVPEKAVTGFQLSFVTLSFLIEFCRELLAPIVERLSTLGFDIELGGQTLDVGIATGPNLI